MIRPLIRPLAYSLLLLLAWVARAAADPAPPDGFTPLFNGRDLAGWHGLNPHEGDKLPPAEREAIRRRQLEEFASHWRVEDGGLVNDGKGPYACTDAEFGDCELCVSYRTVPKADSGVYVRGLPQVQIWDWNQPYDPKKPTRRPHLGSGGLFNNSPGADGRYPPVRADRPFGEWNAFKIRHVGPRTWVWLNDRLVVDGANLENYYDRGRPLPPRGPVLLQTHGGEIRWRDVFVREIPVAEAGGIVAEADARTRERLARSLTLHAPFDRGFDADFASGNKACFMRIDKETVAAAPTADVMIEPAGGRFGGCLAFARRTNAKPSFQGPGTLGYSATGWDASVSVWLRLDPDADLAPGYCDPVQILGDDTKKGFVFLEWSKDETPRLFRYAIQPLFHIWNPEGVKWDEIPFAKRPMVQIEKAPFARDRWTHVVFTLQGVNDPSRPQIGTLFIDGRLQGSIEGWNLEFAWDPTQVAIVLGAAYVGRMDDLAVFDRTLGEADVRTLFALPGGVGDLRR